MKTRLFFLLALLLSVSLACNFLTGGGEAPPPAPTAAQENAPQSSGEATAPATAPTTLPANPTAEEPSQPPATGGEAAPGEVQDIAALAQSYRITIHTTWQPENGDAETNDVILEHTSNPPAEHMSISSPDGNFETFQIGDEAWFCSEGDCFYSQGVSEESPITETFQTDFLNDASTYTQKVGTETVNGFKATHYIITLPPEVEQSIAEGEMSNMRPEVWITEAGKYPPFMIRWTATWDETRNGVAGKGSLTYEVSDVDGDFTITPPENSGGNGGENNGGSNLGGMPAYPGAQVTASMSGYSMMSTADAPQTVSDYFVQNLPDQGWTLQSNDSLGDMYIQTWAKEGQTLSITIMPDDEGTTTIMMTLE